MVNFRPCEACLALVLVVFRTAAVLGQPAGAFYPVVQSAPAPGWIPVRSRNADLAQGALPGPTGLEATSVDQSITVDKFAPTPDGGLVSAGSFLVNITNRKINSLTILRTNTVRKYVNPRTYRGIVAIRGAGCLNITTREEPPLGFSLAWFKNYISDVRNANGVQALLNSTNVAKVPGTERSIAATVSEFQWTDPQLTYLPVLFNPGGTVSQVDAYLGIHPPNSPICASASGAPGRGGAAKAKSLAKSKDGDAGTVGYPPYIVFNRRMGPKTIFLVTSITNASCIAYEMLYGGQKTDKKLDMQSFITNSEGVLHWAQSGFVFDAPTIEVLPNSTCARHSQRRGPCTAFVDNLFPENNYFLFTVNGLETPNADGTYHMIRVTARTSGSCIGTRFPVDPDAPSS